TTNAVTTMYGYDTDGNRTSMTVGGNTTNYTFNVFNQMTAVTGPGLTASYQFDPLGNREGQTVNGVTTRFQIDPIGLGNVVAAYDGGGNLLTHYTYGLGLTNQVSAAGDVHYYDFNLQGSTVGLTDATGAIANTYTYLPFGGTLTAHGTVANPFQF